MDVCVNALALEVENFVIDGPNIENGEDQQMHVERVNSFQNRFEEIKKLLEKIPNTVVAELHKIKFNSDLSDHQQIVRCVANSLYQKGIHFDPDIVEPALVLVFNRFLVYQDYKCYDDELDVILDQPPILLKNDQSYLYRKPYGYPNNDDVITFADGGHRVVNARLFTMQTIPVAK
jgi:hypothetical protein